MTRLTRYAALPIAALAIVLTIAGCPKPSESTTSAPPVGGMPAVAANAAPSSGGAATTITAKGSDTLLQVAQALAEAYKATAPGVEVSVSGGGTGVGFTALTDGTTDIADASRKIKDEETAACQAKGIEPKENLIGYDGIAVIVNKANPVQKLTIDQLSDIYVGTIKDWKAVGGKGEIVLLSRESTSGTYEYFKEHVVQKGDKKSTREYAAEAMLLPSTDQVRSQVASTESAIGYIGLGYLDDSVRAVPIVDKAGKPISPSAETVKSGSYPISRPLFMYTKADAAAAVSSFIEWILGDEGQKIVADEGFVPVD